MVMRKAPTPQIAQPGSMAVNGICHRWGGPASRLGLDSAEGLNYDRKSVFTEAELPD